MPTDPVDPKKPKPVRAHHYPNGMLMVFDADGQQVEEFQGEALTMLPKLKAAHPDVEVLVTKWRTGEEVTNPNLMGHDPLGPLYGPVVVGEHHPKCASLTASLPESDPRCDCGAEESAIEGPPCKHPECGHGARRHELGPKAATTSPRGACQAFDGADEDGCPCQNFIANEAGSDEEQHGEAPGDHARGRRP